MQHAVFHTIAFLAFSCLAFSTLAIWCRIFMSRNFMSRIFSVTENLAFSDGDSVTKPTKPKWRDSNSVVDMISSGGYDSPRRVTSHVHFRVNSVDDQSPTVVVYTHFQLINVVFTRKTLC